MRVLLKLLPPFGSIILAIIFLFFNPYAPDTPTSSDTQIIVILILILPTILFMIALLLNNKPFKYITLLLSLPTALYLGLAGIPSLWNFFVLFICFYPWLAKTTRL